MDSVCVRRRMMMKLLLLSVLLMETSAALQNLCSNSTVLRTRTSCHSCGISIFMSCPPGFKKTPGSSKQDCTYSVRTSSLTLRGCSLECYREAQIKTCCPGFWGPDCQECPEGADRPCSLSGICSDGMGGNGTCTCQPGFAGTACEDCSPGRFGSTCSSVCSCVHGVCDSGLTGDGRCTCFSGYKGPSCDQELPECASLRCPLNSRCMEEALTGQLVCQCLPGYQKSGDTCLSINPCRQQLCHLQASCIHTGPNQHLCACNEGYSGDGRVCMAVDPCQRNQGGCSAETTSCVYDGPGKSHCECLPGFALLRGGGCSLKDACRPDSCHKDATCQTAELGQVQCICNQGFVGNGKVCYGNIMQRLSDLNSEPGGQWRGQLSNAISLLGSLSWSLQTLGPFTLFVPINKGFRGVSIRTLTADRAKAQYLSKMHLVAGVLPFDSLKKTDVFYTVTGKMGEMDTSEGDLQTKIHLHGSRKKAVILQFDVVASNGMIHVINKLMDSVAPTVESNPQENLMKIISDYGKFGTFKSLLEKVSLASVLDQPGPMTIFAPSSAAFSAMPEGQLDFLSSAKGQRKLLELMRNHIVWSTGLDVFNAVSGPLIASMASQVLAINVTENGQILVGGAAVLEAAVEAKNGCLYVLDGVLMPASIWPVLPHRCDLNETQVTMGECGPCSTVHLQSRCKAGSNTGTGSVCVYSLNFAGSLSSVAVKGCSPFCRTNVTTPACCKGFYGPDCTSCPGGYQTPCSGHGQCLEGISGNGSCLCDQNLAGSRCQYCLSSSRFGPNCDRTCPCVHGQCENLPDSDGRCKPDSCQPGFTGRFCERQTAPCGLQVHFCHAHADCDFHQGTLRCVCKPGYQGDGITCGEADPCAPPLRGGCSINAKCVRSSPGAHSCQCLSGWRPDGDDCQPVNNCEAVDGGGCHPNASCIYVGPGQSDCSCKTGYRGSGRECEAVNLCVSQGGGCHHLATCRLLSSQWTCVCDDGYSGDGHVCYGTVSQALTNLPDVSEFSTWTTDSGVSWSLSDQNLTLLVPSSAAVSKMSSEDRTFWTLKGNLPSLLRNHMIRGNFPLSSLSSTSSLTSLLNTSLPVSSTNKMQYSVGGAAITTADIAATNGLIHVIDQVLVPDRKLSEGLLATLALRPEFSLFRSYLIDYNLTEEIEQADEFTIFAPTNAAVNDYLSRMAPPALDVNTTRYHVVLSERLLRTDLQPGGFRASMLGGNFQLRFNPRDGKLFVNEAQLNSSNLLSGNGVIHGVSAVLIVNKNRCDDATFAKVSGDCVDCLFPQGKICPNTTVPDPSVRSRKCMFTRMFENERLLTIGCRATCLQETRVRRCCTGFFGLHCESCPGPAGWPCFGNGFCSDGARGAGDCSCNPGFSGTACESCGDGKYGVHCDQECVCVHGRCAEGLQGDGSCECDVGWRGVLCDQKIESSADGLCGALKCHTSANCVIRSSSPQCLCAVGFEGNGTTCKATDVCVQDNGGCSVFAVCKRTLPGRRECVCRAGYTGDGLVCLGKYKINPCLQGNGGCHSDAECIHVGPNKSSCACSEGYSGDGQTCEMINLCRKRNGGCHHSALCNMTGPGVRSCSCHSNFLGDGISCRGTVARELLARKLRDFYLSLMVTDIPLKGRGPFTVFAPNQEAYAALRAAGHKKRATMGPAHRELLASLLRSHIVMCHTLLPADLARPRNLTSLSGTVLTTRSQEGSIFINDANVTHSNGVSVNGIFHEISKFLVSPVLDQNLPVVPVNLTDVAERHGYNTFYKLLQDAGVMNLLQDPVFQPVTVFLPSDNVMADLPKEQRDFLFHPDNRAQLTEYLKYHVLQGQKVYAEALIHQEGVRTLQGSLLSFNCGGSDAIGDIFVNDGKCRIAQRHLVFNGGMAYGIDCLLTPPSLGGRCDTQTTFDLKLSCGLCTSSALRCPDGSKQKEMQKCDLPSVFISKNSGCRSVCTVHFWQDKCCSGYHGRDCLVCPGGVGAPCSNHGKCDDGHLGNGTCTCDPGFGGVACELCNAGFFGASCRACNCSPHGSCEDGLKGSGACFCEEGWTGPKCDTELDGGVQCTPHCSPKAICQQNNTCVCRPFYQGDGFTCTAVDLCNTWNGGCFRGAQCSQRGEQVSCTCPKGHSGDGFTCTPVDPCSSGDNGGCSEHADCSMTAPRKAKCTCKDQYIGDGLTCDLKQAPLSRCLQDNGRCHQDANCTDLHHEDSKLGVFHVRSDSGQYRLNFSSAQVACAAEGGNLATYNQLSYAQQGGLNMCSAGWLDQARVGYPTTFPNPSCGFGHVGIVDYGIRKNRSETWDAFCYRRKEVVCECKPGYVGDGFSCTGNLMQVLQSTPSFSNFLTQILNSSQLSQVGRQFVKRLSNLTVQSTLFVPENSGLPDNQTLSLRDLEFHLSEGRALPLSHLKNGSRIRTRVGTLNVLGVSDLLNPSTMSSRYINDRFVTDSDILASNGLIHVLQGPLRAPPTQHRMPVAHQAGVGVGVVLLVVLVLTVLFVGFHFYKYNTKPFHFHYFKDEGEEEEEEEEKEEQGRSPAVGGRSICNPVYEAAPEPAESKPVESSNEEDRQEVNGVVYDLLQDC
ncbi:stabilin-2 isoform X2 [Eleginops maclovinus]|uniref:stabilin-2 isoform X2 n=1 Tax=Eleginops maclovinus TaxID=56733 RepID=UPI00307FE6FD